MSILQFISLWAPVVIWAGVIYSLSSIPKLVIPWGIWGFILRKMAHMTEFGILTLLFFRALKGSSRLAQKTLLTLSWSLSVAYAVSDEFHQSFVPGRHGTFRDVVIDASGAAIACFLYTYCPKFYGTA